MKYLLKKEGYYYRSNSCGYTKFAYRAGLFDEKYAKRHAKSSNGEVEAIPVTDLPETDIEEARDTAVASKALLKAHKEAVIEAEHSPAPVYKTEPGESVMGIALRQLGNEDRWSEIIEMNADRFPEMSPHAYYPVGTVLKLPGNA
ncbi:LysM peptidoglycan-binding domain-containing protein [Endozoicomonas arenosclerae]|uniref:LysM peptidoglycan-binding domain-containing protein n=1 Tax=Endozoicomonas arenosclerae TaxID=1633495 RepID=UPI00078615B4|nr:hypothetical protein [Endozoicomonas arenosclerae]